MNKVTIVVIVISVLYFSNDFYQRILISEKNSKIIEAKAIPSVEQLALFSKEGGQKLIESFTEYDIEIDDNAETAIERVQGMSLKQQLQQQGELNKVYAGDYIFQLKAIIKQASSESKHYALIEQYHITNNTTEIIKVIAQQTIFDYHITSIAKASITLRAEPERTINLPLYKVILQELAPN